MKFEINYDGKYQDAIIVEGDTVEEIREKAYAEGDKRGWEHDKCWSREIHN